MLDEILSGLGWWKYPTVGQYVKSIKRGTFEIASGIILPDIPDGWFVRITGSAYNDGVHPSGEMLLDETFEGEVWLLTLPPDLLTIADEIASYQASDAAKPSPYTSESFGGYSYTRATNANGQAAGWKEAFASRLARWRKL